MPRNESAASLRHVEVDATPARIRLATWVRHHGQALLTGLCGLLIILGWIFEQREAVPFSATLYVLGFIAGGWYSARKGLQTLLRERDLDVDLLMVIAAVGAAAIGYWVDGAILILIFSLSGTLEYYALRRTGRDLVALMRLHPETAVLLRGDEAVTVPVASLRPGDIILVKAADRIPADGVIREGESAIDQSSISGESIPVEKGPGDEVFAGTMNGQGVLTIEVTAAADASLLARMVELVREAQEEKPATQHFIDRFERGYARLVILGAALVATLPPFVLGWSWSETLYRATIFLVVASPCALVASTMPAVLSAISNGTRNGILIRSGRQVESLGELKVVAFDKTGTITIGRPQVTDVIAVHPESWDDRAVLQLAASLESWSEHPLARAVVEAAHRRGIPFDPPEKMEEISGFGLRGEVGGKLVQIGRPQWIEAWGFALDPSAAETIAALQEAGKTVALLTDPDRVLGIIAFQDTIRPSAAPSIAALRRLGIVRTVLLTGDTRRSGEAIGRAAGVDEVHAELLPQDKVAKIRELTERYGKVAMVGDGVNDAPALATAAVGIAMGSAGSDITLETADVVLVADDLAKVPYAITLGRRARRVVRQNITFAITVIGLLLLSNFLALITLPLGVVGHEGSTLLVILNGLRLLGGNASEK